MPAGIASCTFSCTDDDARWEPPELATCCASWLVVSWSESTRLARSLLSSMLPLSLGTYFGRTTQEVPTYRYWVSPNDRGGSMVPAVIVDYAAQHYASTAVFSGPVK